MLTKRVISTLALAALLSVPAAGSAMAAPVIKADSPVSVVSSVSNLPAANAPTAKDLRVAQRRVSPREAKQIALSRVPGGEVVDIRLSGNVYRVRVIARNGKVVDIAVDANTGRVR